MVHRSDYRDVTIVGKLSGGQAMKCCICGGDVDKHYTPQGVMYWDKGHNPDPVKTGEDDRCCDACNTNVVIPARFKTLLPVTRWEDDRA